MNVIILCGGSATRLRDITEDRIPKCMVDIKGTPFIKYQLDQLSKLRTEKGYAITRVILAVGKFSEQVIEYVQSIQYKYPFEIFYSIETSPLGTGGAMKRALKFVKPHTSTIMVMNGDVVNDINYHQLIQTANKFGANTMTISLVEVENTDRFGIVKIDNRSRIREWSPKKYVDKALANRGVYIFNRLKDPFNIYPECFSFEGDYVHDQVRLRTNKVYGIYQEGYFKDIGIPSDYNDYCEHVKS